MRGFADYALVLFSDYGKYAEASSEYRRHYMAAVKNLFAYLKSQQLWIRCLVTDPLACVLVGEFSEVEWQATENPGGLYFMYNNMRHFHIASEKLPKEIVAAMDAKYPIERGITKEMRMNLVSKRVAIAEKALIKQAKAVFCFGSAFKTYPKENDGRAVISINNQFIPSLKLSGNDAPIGSFLNVPWGNLSLTDWGKYLNG